MFKFKKGQILASENFKYKIEILGTINYDYYMYKRLHDDSDLALRTSDNKYHIEKFYFLYNPSSIIWRAINE